MFIYRYYKIMYRLSKGWYNFKVQVKTVVFTESYR
nr:MAG TPA: hypothetical protein [Caudoviricetes sp.]